MKKYAVIVAGGTGTRMQSAVPKQFLSLQGEPVLYHTLRRFHEFEAEMEIFLVLPLASWDQWKELTNKQPLTVPYTLVAGGKTRFKSVKNGLAAIKEKEGWVAIHDGVRPFVSRSMLLEGFHVAETFGNATATVELKDSIREKLSETDSVSRLRKDYMLVQTPQIFNLKRMWNVYESLLDDPSFTDDATIMEKFGEKISTYQGSYMNLKITTPEDLPMAEAIGRNFRYES